MEQEDNISTIDLLPPELWVAVFRHLSDSAADVRSLAAASQACRFFRDVTQDESIWRTILMIWDPWRIEDASETQSWRLTFQKEVFWHRTVPLRAGITSKYMWGDGYECTIQKLIFEPHAVRVYIDERGSGLLGEIQDPERSALCIRKQDQTLVWIRSMDHKMSIADPMAQYLGWVLYEPMNLILGSTICFRYGTAGYSFVDLVAVDQGLIDKYRLQHLVVLKAVKENPPPELPLPILEEEVDEWVPFHNEDAPDGF
eukprot:TRINITY_DN2867_c0_g1_i1.p1 TRINITY_DN2867_c0_g1~~TRINITY_DN2867_c0_g1_i1.p1  ORF type:complete len:257 (-),score=34.05 TRINITY_DN2867_c0_g1_i1:36-806(-)